MIGSGAAPEVALLVARRQAWPKTAVIMSKSKVSSRFSYWASSTVRTVDLDAQPLQDFGERADDALEQPAGIEQDLELERLAGRGIDQLAALDLVARLA